MWPQYIAATSLELSKKSEQMVQYARIGIVGLKYETQQGQDLYVDKTFPVCLLNFYWSAVILCATCLLLHVLYLLTQITLRWSTGLIQTYFFQLKSIIMFIWLVFGSVLSSWKQWSGALSSNVMTPPFWSRQQYATPSCLKCTENVSV